jgi:hypothetical protein
MYGNNTAAGVWNAPEKNDHAPFMSRQRTWTYQSSAQVR